MCFLYWWSFAQLKCSISFTIKEKWVEGLMENTYSFVPLIIRHTRGLKFSALLDALLKEIVFISFVMGDLCDGSLP